MAKAKARPKVQIPIGFDYRESEMIRAEAEKAGISIGEHVRRLVREAREQRVRKR